MNDRILHKLDFARKALLTMAAVLAIAVPVTFGLLHPTPGRAQAQLSTAAATAPIFSSLSIKPSPVSSDNLIRTKIMFAVNDGSFTARGVTLQRLIQMAYHIQDSQLSGGPDWLNSTKFDIDAKLDDSFVAAMNQKTSDHKHPDDQAMLKALLADQFKLVMHSQNQILPGYDLVVDANGSKLQEAGGMRMIKMGRGELTSSGTPIEFLAEQLSIRLGQTVVDRTGLKATYAFSLHWTPDPSEDQRLEQSVEAGLRVAPVHPTDPGDGQHMKLLAEQADRAHPLDPNAPTLLAAVQEQLGLKLEPQTEHVQVLVVDHAEVPSQNQ